MSIRLLTGKSSSSGGCFSWRKHRLKQRQISSFCLAKQAPQGGKYPSWRFSLVPDTYIQKTKKLYIDSRARRNLGSINTELQDVQRIMVANIEEVLQRGEALSGTCGGCCLAYAYPQSVTWVEHIRWKVLKSRGLLRKAMDSAGASFLSVASWSTWWILVLLLSVSPRWVALAEQALDHKACCHAILLLFQLLQRNSFS